MSRSAEFFHGTNAALNPGDHVLPRKSTGIGESWTGNKDPKDRIWVTSTPEDAHKHALQATYTRGGSPSVYRVQPVQRVPFTYRITPQGVIQQHTAAHAVVIGKHEKEDTA